MPQQVTANNFVLDPSKWTASCRAELGAVLGLREASMADYAARGCPPTEATKDARVKEYYLPDVLRWLRGSSGPWRDKKVRGSAATREGDVPLDGPDADSPNLEKKRFWEAEKAEIDVRKLRGEFVPRAVANQLFLAFAGAIRAAGDQIERQHGSDVADVIRTAVDDGIAAAKRLLEKEAQE